MVKSSSEKSGADGIEEKVDDLSIDFAEKRKIPSVAVNIPYPTKSSLSMEPYIPKELEEKSSYTLKDVYNDSKSIVGSLGRLALSSAIAYGNKIDKEYRIKKEDFDASSIQEALGFVFSKLSISEDKRAEISKKILNLILQEQNSSQIYDNDTFVSIKAVTSVTDGSSPWPTEAPKKWKDREPGESPPDFTRRTYGPWLKDGISKRNLRRLDAALVNELNAWTRNGNEMPDDIKILTVSEENARLLSAGYDAIQEHLGKFSAEEARREAERLRSAKARKK